MKYEKIYTKFYEMFKINPIPINEYWHEDFKVRDKFYPSITDSILLKMIRLIAKESYYCISSEEGPDLDDEDVKASIVNMCVVHYQYTYPKNQKFFKAIQSFFNKE